MKTLEIFTKIIALPFVVVVAISFGIIGLIVGHGFETSKMFLKGYLTLYY